MHEVCKAVLVETAVVCCVELTQCTRVLAGVVWQLADSVVMLGHQECIVGSLCISAHLHCSAALLMVMLAVVAVIAVVA